MTGETVFTVSGNTAKVTQPIGLADAGLRERDHLQEWVIAHPQVLGADVKVITSEFGRWTASTGVERDRLDILGLDRDGRLVVVELKRDKAPDTVEMQAIKYAALASRFTRETLSRVHADYLTRRRAEQVEPEAALAEMEEWAVLDEETLRLPRITLMASAFPPTVTATVVWLHQQLGLDIRLLAFQAYRTDNDVLLTVSQTYPPPDVEVLSPELKEQKQARDARQTRQREANTVARLVEEGILEPGTRLRFQAPSTEVQNAVEGWLTANPQRRFAEWQDHPSQPLLWAADGQTYSPTRLAQHILEEAAQRTGAIQGPAYWVTDDDESLVALAAALPSGAEVPVETHLDALSPNLRPTYEALDNVLRSLGPDVTARSRVKGIGYLAQRKIADLRFRSDNISVLIRGLDPGEPDVAALTVSKTSRYILVHAKTPGDVPAIEALLRKAYDAQKP